MKAIVDHCYQKPGLRGASSTGKHSEELFSSERIS